MLVHEQVHGRPCRPALTAQLCQLSTLLSQSIESIVSDMRIVIIRYYCIITRSHFCSMVVVFHLRFLSFLIYQTIFSHLRRSCDCDSH